MLGVESYMGRSVEGDPENGVAENVKIAKTVFLCSSHLNPVSASGRVAGSSPFSSITVSRFARIYKDE